MAVQQHQTAAQTAAQVISSSEQREADDNVGKVEKRLLHRDRPNPVHLTLDLELNHAAYVTVLIQPLHVPGWNGYTFFAAAINDVYSCCFTASILQAISAQVAKVLSQFYPQAAINVPAALPKARRHHVEQTW